MKTKIKDITKKQFKKWKQQNCISGVVECNKCPFEILYCSDIAIDHWINSKDMFSEKFLNQEVEIEGEELLNAKEKEYLETILRPFKNKVVSITKHRTDIGQTLYEWISVKIKSVILTADTVDTIEFPSFKPYTMYKNMELDNHYTLKELGLFENEK